MIEETPWWIYVVLVFVFFSGVKAMHRRTLTLPKLFVLPSLLILWSFHGIYTRWQGIWTDSFYWIAFLIAGSLIGWFMIHNWKVHIDRGQKTLNLPGTKTTLWLALAIFLVRYFFAHYYAVHTAIPHSILLAEITTSATIAGIFIGRSLNLWYRYQN